MQNGPVVCYVMHELELVVFMHALNMWRNYLMSRKFELRTNHNGMEYLFQEKKLNARKTRWM